MGTYADLRARIEGDINRSDITTDIQKAINRAIEHYEKERFWFNENTWTFSTSAGGETIAFASASVSDMLTMDEVTLTRNSTDIYPLEQKTIQELRDINTAGTSTQGPPTIFAIFNDTFYFYPVPDTAYTVTIYGQKSYAALSASADTNDFTTEAEDLIESRARAWVYSRKLRNYEAAAASKTEEMEALAALREKTINLLGTGKIRSRD